MVVAYAEPARGEGAGFGAGGAGPVGGVPVLPGRPDGAGATPTDVSAVTVTVTFPGTPLTVAVIVAVPGALPVTLPLASTLATFVLLELHVAVVVISCVVLSEKVAVAANDASPPTLTVVLPAMVTLATTAGLTPMPLTVPLIDPLPVSVAESVWLPADLKATVTVFTPMSARV